MAINALTPPKVQFFDDNGDPLSGGLIYTYEPGTSTEKPTYSDSDGTVANENPVELNSRGEASIYLDGSYKIVVKTSADVTVYTVDNFTGAAGFPVNDTVSIVQDPSDNTKQVRIDAGSITTGTTRVLTMPDRDVSLGTAADENIGTSGDTVPLLSGNNTWSGVQTFTSSSDFSTAGAYFGDTAAANLLDDYEEGTWTPTYEPASGAFGAITYDAVTAGYYTKIGRHVFFAGRIRTDAITVGTASGVVSIGGLPFTGTSTAPSAIAIGLSSGFAGESPSGGHVNLGATTITLRYHASTAAQSALSTASDVTDLGTGADANDIIFSGHYSV